MLEWILAVLPRIEDTPMQTSQSRVLAAPNRIMVRFAGEEPRKLCEQAGFRVKSALNSGYN